MRMDIFENQQDAVFLRFTRASIEESDEQSLDHDDKKRVL